MQWRHATCTFECIQLVALFCSAKRAIAAAADNALLPLFTDFLTTMHTSDAVVLWTVGTLTALRCGPLASRQV